MWPFSSNGCGRHHFEENGGGSYRVHIYGCSYHVEQRVLKKCVHEGCDERRRGWVDVTEGELRTHMVDEAGDILEEFLTEVDPS